MYFPNSNPVNQLINDNTQQSVLANECGWPLRSPGHSSNAIAQVHLPGLNDLQRPESQDTLW